MIFGDVLQTAGQTIVVLLADSAERSIPSALFDGQLRG